MVKIQQQHSCIGSVNVQQNHITSAQTNFLPGDVHSRLPQTRRRACLLSIRLEDVLKKHQTNQMSARLSGPGVLSSVWDLDQQEVVSGVCCLVRLCSHAPTLIHVEPRPLSQKEQVLSNLLCYKQAKKNKCSLRRPLPRSDVPACCCCGKSGLHFGPSPQNENDETVDEFRDGKKDLRWGISAWRTRHARRPWGQGRFLLQQV